MMCLFLYYAGQRWDDLVDITRATGLELLFDLNLQLRYGTQWDPSNAIALMDYSQKKGYGNNLHFELGNGNKKKT